MSSTEKHLLGHCLSENLHVLQAAEFLKVEDFYFTSHQSIFHAIRAVMESGQTADIVTVGQFLTKHSQIESVGGIAYLCSLTEGLVRRNDVRDYAEMILKASQLRRLQHLTELVGNEAALASADLEELLSEAESGLLEIRSATSRSGEAGVAGAIVPLIDRLFREHVRKDELLGLPSGLDSLDLMTCGLQPGEVTVVGARSGVGKSSLMTQAAIANCQMNTSVLIVSLEMSRDQVLRRILAAISRVPFPRIRDPKWATVVDMDNIKQASAVVFEWPLHIIDDSSFMIDQLVAKARLAVRRDAVKLICVDYAQIVGAPAKDERLRVAAVSRGLTRLAKDEGIPVMVLSQLSRADRSNPNRRPTMSDLRESSQLENDAHSIVLLHREWSEEEGRLSSDGELIVAKQRSGETGVVPVTFNRRSLCFERRGVNQISSQSRTETYQERKA